MTNEVTSIVKAFETSSYDNMMFWEFKEATKGKTQNEFTKELIRFLAEASNNNLLIEELLPNANLGDFIYMMNPKEVNSIEVFDCSSEHCDATTFGLNIKFSTGIVTIITGWCVWSGSNSKFIFEYFFAPLYIAELANKVIFNSVNLFAFEPKDAYFIMSDYAMRSNPSQFEMANVDVLNEKQVSTYSNFVTKAHQAPKAIEDKVVILKSLFMKPLGFISTNNNNDEY